MNPQPKATETSSGLVKCRTGKDWASRIWQGKAAPVWQRLLLAILWVAVASGLRLLLFRNQGDTLPYLLFYPALIIAALFGGLAAGLLATALSSGLVFFWLHQGVASPLEILGLELYLLFGLMISIFGESVRRAQNLAKQAQAQAEETHQKLKQKIAEHRQSELNNQKLASIVEFSEDAIFSTDLEGSVTSWNRGAEKVFGHTAGEMLGASLQRLIPAERQEEKQQILAKVKRGESVEHFETEWQTKDGRRLNISITASPIKDADGQIIGVSKVARDVTERKRVEAELSSAQRKLERGLKFQKALLLAIPTPIFYKDRQGRYLGCNRAFTEMMGVTSEELAGKTVQELWPGELAETYHREDLELMRQPQLLQCYESQVLDKHGVRRDVIFAKDVFFDENDQMVGIVGAVLDITERKQAEMAMASSSAYARSLIESSLDPLVTISAEGKITDVNEASAKATGRSRAELVGTDFSDYFTEREQAHAVYQRVFSEGQVRDYPLTIRHVSGGITEVLYNASLYHDIQGRVLGVFAAARDITERKKAEQEVQRLTAELEQRVQSRTAQLTQANQELEAFSYSVSHDLRSPLRAIDGFSQILLEDYHDKLDAEGQDSLKRVRAASQRMGRLIDDLLQLSRYVRSDLRQSSVDLSALAHAVADDLRRHAPERQVDFVIAPNLVAVADPNLIRVVLENLLGNAWKFTARQPRARIEFGRLRADGQHAFFVRDNGAGFDMDYAPKLFNAFERLHSITEFPGTGIGLANVQRLIQRHSGRVWAEGKVNEGATFYFTLPGAGRKS